MIPYSGLAEPLLQPVPALAAQVPAGEDAQTVHPFGGFRPNAMEPANLQLSDERGTGGGRDHILAIGFVLVRGEFCKKLVVGDAGRCGEPGFTSYARPNLCGGRGCGRQAAPVGGDIEKRLGERPRLEQRGGILEDRTEERRVGKGGGRRWKTRGK